MFQWFQICNRNLLSDWDIYKNDTLMSRLVCCLFFLTPPTLRNALLSLTKVWKHQPESSHNAMSNWKTIHSCFQLAFPLTHQKCGMTSTHENVVYLVDAFWCHGSHVADNFKNKKHNTVITLQHTHNRYTHDSFFESHTKTNETHASPVKKKASVYETPATNEV